MLRRFLPVVLGLYLIALFLPGCTKPRAADELVLMMSVPLVQEAGWTSALEAFTQATEIKVSLKNIPPESYAKKLPALLRGKTAPDVASIRSTDVPALIGQGVLADLKPVLQGQKDLRLSDFTPWAIRSYQQAGAVYGLPYDLTVQVVAYNQDHFELEGLTAPRQWTWEQYVAAARKLNRDTDDNGVTDRWGTLAPPYWQVLVWQEGGDLVDNPTAPQRSTLAAPEAQRGLQKLVDLIVKDKLAPGSALPDSPTRVALFVNGQAGLAPVCRGDFPLLDKGREIRWAVLPFPTGARAANLGLSSAFCLPKSAPHAEQAAKLLLFLTGLDGQRQLANTGFLTPALEAVQNSMEYFPPTSIEGDNAFLDGIKVARSLPVTPLYPQMEAIYRQELAALWEGKATVEQVTTKIDERINALLGQAKPATAWLLPLTPRG